jgi:NAD(P)-dependent dehydrogenase (short-subunit alcohol dehydrogenase family)
VVWVSSLFSKVGGKAHAAYAACKAAANAYVRCAALELAPRVRVNALVLGSVDTPMAANALSDPEIAASIAATVPLGLGKPEQVADTIAFLVSEQSRWITGQEIVVDGGRSINFSHK